MKIVLDAASFSGCLETIEKLLGPEVDVVLSLTNGKALLEASNPEGWIQTKANVLRSDGEGKAFTKLEYLKVAKTKAKEITLSYEGADNIAVEAGRTRGAVRVLNESDIEITRPDNKINIEAVIPEKLVRFAAAATVFKPLLDASSPNTIIEVEDKEFRISCYDEYIGTCYTNRSEDIQTKENFRLVVEMDFWKAIVGRIGQDGVVKMGADEHSFRIRTNTFDLYYAVVDDSTQDVKGVIEGAKENAESTVIDFDGKAVTEAIDSTKGILRSADKDGARFFITIRKDIAILSAESNAGEMEAEFDVSGYDGVEDIEFRVSSDTFADTLKLTRDEGLKYGPVRLHVLADYIVMESLKVPAMSIAPVLAD